MTASDAGRLGRPAAPAALARERRWYPPARPVIVGLLAIQTTLAVAFTVWPPDPSNRTLNGVLAAVLAGATILCAAGVRRRGSLAALHGWLVVTWAVPMMFILTRNVEGSQLVWAAVVVLTAVVTAFYLPARGAAVQVTAILTAFLLVTVAADAPTRPLFVVAFASTILICCVTVALMRRDRDRLLLELTMLVTTDPLTGLLNRRGLDDEAVVVRANALRAGRATVVATIDLDGLKEINDALGHGAGDALITGATAHWRAALREGDLLARVGGDEFVLVLPQTDEAAAADLLTRLRDSSTTAWSHGWTVWAPDEPLGQALNRADALMYAEKVDRRRAR